MAGQSAKIVPVLRGEISNTQIRPLNGHPPSYITIGDRRLRTVVEATGLWDAESIIFNRGRSVASWTFTGWVFHHAQRPVERAPA